ncbi:hypothetical protein DW159_12765 [Coprococcus sp. AM14-16]|uniref:AbiTii domain-containing protein n=1 Tax=Coprococcus TaxID=33042 RepID=UPI000E429D64|nr:MULTISPECIES: hypothetical protein [Coprococcus]RGD39239.1 hypothetical protein DW159_12765 [Coprococcus sp. AM14-16]
MLGEKLNKIEKALEACEKVIDGIEDSTITTESALLQCSKIARLTNDEENLIWLQYEYGGYPQNNDGRVISDAWNIAYKKGRGYQKDGKLYIFTELASELEEKITAQQKAVGNFTTNGASVSGELALMAMDRLTTNVHRSTITMVADVAIAQKRLASLKAQYYEYALKKHIELNFGNVATDVFARYREQVDLAFSELSKETLLKLQAIEGKINSGNPEMYSQALTTCRRLFESTAVELFSKHFPDYKDKVYKTKSGAEIDVSGNHYKNKLSAVIEKLEDKSMKKTLVGSNVIYLLDWIDNLSNLQCEGVHSDITKEDAERCILQTYMCLGDVLTLQ